MVQGGKFQRGGVPAKDSFSVKVFKDENVIKAEAKARAIIEEAKLNKAIKTIVALEIEVAGMEIAQRFSRTRKPSDSIFVKKKSMATHLIGLTEEEYKRTQLLRDLGTIKGKITQIIENLKFIIMEIEATKQEG